MAGRLVWYGGEELGRITAGVRQNVKAASVYLASVIKADISQPGTARAGRRNVYNFTHSVPGNPPYKQTGRLRASIAWEVEGLVGRVGTNVKYGYFLEKGTRRMGRRPYLVRNLNLHFSEVQAILRSEVRPGALGSISGNQFRPGFLGAGARKFGYS